jgi:predicted nucleic acid-binding protein
MPVHWDRGRRAADWYNALVKPTVYIETTIPSFYFDQRQAMSAQIERTRQWWDAERDLYQSFVSPAVLVELDEGNYAAKAQCMSLVADLPMLEAVQDVERIAEVYRIEKLMPGPPSADAIHLAFAAYYEMDYLLTWNIRHLANVRKEEHLRVINARLRIHTPRLVTPEVLLPWEDEP